MPENPDWTRDELILALDLYFQGGRRQLSADSQEIVELSHLLNQLPIHRKEIRQTDFRNPHGVSMKLGNFLSHDPDYPGTGLQRGSRLEREIWAEFSGNIHVLEDTAAAIRATARWSHATKELHDIRQEDEEFLEGRILTYLHKSKERKQKAVKDKKEAVLRETGRLACEACGFDFVRIYGSLGNGFAECHHVIPIANLTEDYPTRLGDLAIVCANCHRMIHRHRPILTVRELQLLIEENAAQLAG